MQTNKTESIKDIFNRLYSPKSLIIEDKGSIKLDYGPDYYISDIKRINCSPNSAKSMIHSIVSVNKLRENYEQEHSVTYDVVITLRPDIFLINPFLDLETFAEKLSDNDIALCTRFKNNFKRFQKKFKKVKFLNDLEESHSACDILYFAKPQAQKSLAKLMDHMDSYYEYLHDCKGIEGSFIRVVQNELNLNYKITRYSMPKHWVIFRNQKRYKLHYYVWKFTGLWL